MLKEPLKQIENPYKFKMIKIKKNKMNNKNKI